MKKTTRSNLYFESAKELVPNGVSSPMRSFSLVGGNPIMLDSALGSRVKDVDGNEYIDFLSGFGAIFLGHARKEISTALESQIKKGLVYGLCSRAESELAGKIVSSTPAIDKVRFVCSGSEAVMTALRIARAYTRRKKLVKFIGSYHGHADALLAQPLEGSRDKVKGATDGVVENDVFLCEYNNLNQLERIFADHGDEIAAVMVEPIATNMGLVRPKDGFHKAIRKLCDDHSSLFIFDEVVTGFRFRFGGVSKLFDVDPDLTTFGKIIGGGAPIGAYGGKNKFMKMVEVGGAVFQSGTFAGNPLSMVAGNAALDLMIKPAFYENMEKKGALMEKEMTRNFTLLNIPYRFTRFGSLCGIAFRPNDSDMMNYADVKTQHYDIYKSVHIKMRELGYLMAPSLEEPIFLTDSHSEEDIRKFAKDISESISSLIKSDGKASRTNKTLEAVS